ncbi:15-hydroxyprostaglandin dehydrogenase [NAD(+)]-like [Pectinophora gossypiella]|uniref:15-hydroxyprostaglandin dehydrogenase [NAD(+)]-like n=1 Tax=Pectinophora gossypiella TaxID=13191 RepID=UPI00214E185A|nr:15-hydroxyprostaglandin dehydrogenase [NAD(+)]-like [Pectinophora gossypiella]
MSYEWKNKVVIITGAASGIGEKVVRCLLQEDVKHISVLDVNEKAGVALQNELNSKYGANKIKFYKCDVTKDDQLFGAFASVKDDQGYLDVLINNAGIMNDSLPVYKKEIEINVTALVSGTLKALEIMRKDGGGRGGTVINISSVAGLTKMPMMPIYWATKAAVLQFSNCIGHDDYHARTGVRLLSICFGATETALLTKLATFDKQMNDVLEQTCRKYPVQSAESAARGLIDAYKNGVSGSIWLVNNNKPALDISDRYNKFYDDMMALVFQ